MRRAARWFLLAGLLVLLAGGAKPAAAALITVDELGNGFIDGTPLAFALATDPGPGNSGVPALTYTLPFAGLQGDVLMQEGGVTTDVLRFNGNGTLVFYSAADDLDTPPSLADGPVLPITFYPRQATIVEVGTETDNGAFYTPNDVQPGFDARTAPTYHFVSDGVAQATPEPGTLALTGLGMLGLVAWLRRRRKPA
jgi:hypothetical protein